uniref:pantoate--beta-alanine ligase n=1 Tax=Staphylococcus epidermidis TaxID=1282 RepID=UPI001643134A
MSKVIRKINEMECIVKEYEGEGKRIGLVGSMGGLDDGDLRMMKECVKEIVLRVISIFVNGLEFGGNEDFDGYGGEVDDDVDAV